LKWKNRERLGDRESFYERFSKGEANLWAASLKLPGQPTSFYSDGFLWAEFMTSEALNAFIIIEQRKRIQANCPCRTFFLTQATLTTSRLINFGIDPEDSYSQGSK